MNNPKISIITIVKNGASTIERTIKSVLNQNYSNLEYIIIDGLSTDGTLEIIKKYNINYISEADLGISDAFNKGLRLATGDLIGIINSDDYYQPNIFKIVADTFINNPESIICGYLKLFFENRPFKISKSEPYRLNKTMSICHPTVFVPNLIYKKYGNFSNDYKYSMDFDLMLRFYIKNVSFEVLPVIIANMQAGGISDKYYKQSRYEIIQIKKLNDIKHFQIVDFLSIYIHLAKKRIIKFIIKIGLEKRLFNLFYKWSKFT
jgi:glycosyltransferase involved in cell wall biosynthesis